MKKKDKMKRLGILLLALTAITVIITFVIVMNLSDPIRKDSHRNSLMILIVDGFAMFILCPIKIMK